ncbi:hypothetical protein H696_01400 [Fonticula alba]|uniref:Sulfotransferase domain-containing protein n=1 Tax=Fonticula alba TaxID=691883 RepID=A0A058ZDJ5_FONAL|nr:hypothetical protein H696_01400 [Fonticula alba]KCV71993.1 hypothetical protein H696_01400 [Fonticula alba]|eukprot:XP_009493571.1 hypothetical protein H696_01400 [Fonticula alba]
MPTLRQVAVGLRFLLTPRRLLPLLIGGSLLLLFTLMLVLPGDDPGADPAVGPRHFRGARDDGPLLESFPGGLGAELGPGLGALRDECLAPGPETVLSVGDWAEPGTRAALAAAPCGIDSRWLPTVTGVQEIRPGGRAPAEVAAGPIFWANYCPAGGGAWGRLLPKVVSTGGGSAGSSSVSSGPVSSSSRAAPDMGPRSHCATSEYHPLAERLDYLILGRDLPCPALVLEAAPPRPTSRWAHVPAGNASPAEPLRSVLTPEREALLGELARRRALFQAPRPHVFLHLPKCAGTALATMARIRGDTGFAQFWGTPTTEAELGRAAAADFIFGHVRHGVHSLMRHTDGTSRPWANYFTIMREPVKRVISHYFYHKSEKKDPYHYLADTHGLDEWVQIHPDAKNIQTQYLSGTYGPPDAMAFAVAMRNLLEARFVGLFERLPESALMLRYEAGFEELMFARTKAVQGERPVVTQEQRQLIAERNNFDIQLYELAKQRFEESRQRLGGEFFDMAVGIYKEALAAYQEKVGCRGCLTGTPTASPRATAG